jgi:fumarate reductase flavoprotein subunit
VADGDRSYHLGWHDWMNLRNLIAVSRVIAQSALAREDSRGAHFREDFPEAGPLEASACIVAQLGADGGLTLHRQPVRFGRVRPGQSLVAD